MSYTSPHVQFSGKFVVHDPKAELVYSGKVVPLNDGSGAWVFVSKPPTLMDKLNKYYESNCSRK